MHLLYISSRKIYFHRPSLNQHRERKKEFTNYYYLDLFVYLIFHLAIFYKAFKTLIKYELFSHLSLSSAHLGDVTFQRIHSTQWQILSWRYHSKLHLLFNKHWKLKERKYALTSTCPPSMTLSSPENKFRFSE